MKITMQYGKCVSENGHSLRYLAAGETCEVSDSTASSLIAAGFAVESKHDVVDEIINAMHSAGYIDTVQDAGDRYELKSAANVGA